MEITKRKRTENTTIACPIVYGSFSQWNGKKAEERATHTWSIYVRGPNDEDLSCFISKMVFNLHSSFDKPVREVVAPPFIVTENGWGEFEAGIRIHFRDSEESPIEILHMVKLFHENGTPQSLRKPVIHEKYDEIVFTDPTYEFKQFLMMYKPPTKRLPNFMTVNL